MSKLTAFEHLEAAVAAARQYAGSAVGELAQSAAGAISELAEQKADRAMSTAVTIPASGWNSDSTAAYPKYYDIAVTGVTDSDRASVDIAPASQPAAAACGLCPACETLAGKIRLRAVSVPASALTASYWIEKGA